MDAQERAALGRLCAELPDLSDECARQPAAQQALLERIEQRARNRRPVAELFAELLGRDPESVRGLLGSGLPGQGTGRANEERFGCPDGACDRRAATTPAGPLPRCHVTGTPMRRV